MSNIATLFFGIQIIFVIFHAINLCYYSYITNKKAKVDNNEGLAVFSSFTLKSTLFFFVGFLIISLILFFV